MNLQSNENRILELFIKGTIHRLIAGSKIGIDQQTMNRFQIAGVAKNDVSKKMFLTIPKAKHYTSIDNLETVAEDTVKKSF